ncbi:hypothetical protein ACJJTC_002106 [Scirpophaga incertulas]
MIDNNGNLTWNTCKIARSLAQSPSPSLLGRAKGNSDDRIGITVKRYIRPLAITVTRRLKAGVSSSKFRNLIIALIDHLDTPAQAAMIPSLNCRDWHNDTRLGPSANI